MIDPVSAFAMDSAAYNAVKKGNVTGNAATATKLVTANFTIEESGGKLIFKHGTTTSASLSSTGVFTAISNVTASGTP